MASRKPKTGTAAHGAPPALPLSPPPAHADPSRRFLEGQSIVLQQVAAGAPLPDVLCGISRLVEQQAPKARCAVALFDRDGRSLRHVKGPHIARKLLDAVSAVAPDSAGAPWARAIAERRPRMIADLSDAAMAPALRQGASAAGFRACLAHPVSGEGDRLLGMFMLFYPDAGAAEPDDQVVIELLSPVVRVAVDLDQRLQALHSADERFSSLAASIPGVVYQRLVTPEGQIRYTYISEGVRDLFGVSPDEVLADPQALFNRHDPSYAATFRERLLSASRTLEMWDVEATIISRDGKQKHTHAIARPHQQRDGSVLWNGLILDQTRIKKAELAATAAEARTREAIIESLPQGLTLFDADDGLTVCNSAYLKLYPQVEGVAVAGADYAKVIRAEFEHESAGGLPIDERLQARVEQRRSRQHAIERQLADGRWILISERRTADGGTVILHTDISTLKRREEERSKLQDQLYRAQKMEAMGRLAGGIAHDFNNLLASILGNAAFLVEDLPADSETWDFAEQIRTAGERAKHLVQQILAFSRQQESEQTNIDPESIVNETVQLMRAALPKSISLNLRLRSDKVTIRGNPTQLVQVLVNLCVNARDAIGNQHGSIDIETDLVGPGTGSAGDDVRGMLHDRQHLATAPLQPGVQYLCIKVRDTGCGMDARTMERMFEPFFTTKEVGKGTGLGLAAVHGIVSAHGGVVVATSRPGHGTSFGIFIPTIAEPASVEADAIEDKPFGSEAILIVDDERQVSSMLAKMLGRIGYMVDCFNSAPEAIEAFKREPGKWSLVITDQTMPQMTGLELAKRILAQSPNLPVILCSGYTDSVSNDMVAAAGIKAFLTKPVDHANLARMIRELLGTRAASSPARGGRQATAVAARADRAR
jgi:signal transduction histidine kinase/FixJ family two-component response regulator